MLYFSNKSSIKEEPTTTAVFFFFFKILFIYFRQSRREKEKERNINVWFPLECPLLGTWPGPQARHMPWLGIEPMTLWFAGQCSTHWATPARAHYSSLKQDCLKIEVNPTTAMRKTRKSTWCNKNATLWEKMKDGLKRAEGIIRRD